MKTRLIIEIREGNIVHVTSNNIDVEYQIFDHDNAGVQTTETTIKDFTSKFEPDSLATHDEMVELTQKAIDEYGASNPVIGFQLVHSQTGELHPDIDSSFCVYSFTQVSNMDMYDNDDNYEIIEIKKDTIEEPTMMFSGDPYGYKNIK